MVSSGSAASSGSHYISPTSSCAKAFLDWLRLRFLAPAEGACCGACAAATGLQNRSRPAPRELSNCAFRATRK
eukprot:7763773-Lingulodinium_polyedra.AAC.1